MPSKRTRRPKPKARAARSSRARRAPAKRTGPGRIRKAGSRVAGHLSPRAAEALGVGLVVLTALWIMGLWLGTGGPVGHATPVSVRALFAPAGGALPVRARYWAILCPPRPARGQPRMTRPALRAAA